MKTPVSWKSYFRYDLPVSWRWYWVKSWLFQVWCYQDGADYVGFTLFGLTWSATRYYYFSPTWKVKNNFILSWLVKNVYLDINT